MSENVPVAHPPHDHRSTDEFATWIVPRSSIPVPLKDCVAPLAEDDVDELLVTVVVVVVVTVRVAVWVTTWVFAGVVTVRVGAVTVLTCVTTFAAGRCVAGRVTVVDDVTVRVCDRVDDAVLGSFLEMYCVRVLAFAWPIR